MTAVVRLEKKLVVNHFAMALNDSQCQWKLLKQPFNALEEAVHYIHNHENLLKGEPTKLHKLTAHSQEEPRKRADDSPPDDSVASLLRDMEVILSRKFRAAPSNPRGRCQVPQKCRKCS